MVKLSSIISEDDSLIDDDDMTVVMIVLDTAKIWMIIYGLIMDRVV